MKVLISREFDEMFYWKKMIYYHNLFGAGIILLTWILGPKVAGLTDVENMNMMICLIGLLFVYGRLSYTMKQEAANRQITFLQTLPVRKNYIIHAKFLSNLGLCAASFIWMLLFVSLNQWINASWTFEAWMMASVFISMALFIAAIMQICHFIWGAGGKDWIFYIALAIWGVIAISSGFLLEDLGISFTQFWLLLIIVPMVIYFICWWVTIWWTNRSGFPDGGKYADARLSEGGKK
ncbi:ABC-2 transporter permease [Virgibacillus sp. NKC19-16]|uniref:ABC-2 transporter permease n=1 Tax=Virgibacillus salidurans TaxID=2831673 RepID=UPI001F21E640|nr:ABC-2 transporter permease [Virgibacillus sp. NKC19-16]UJL46175.1 ABC-2 transporter permease [Virgibacillus sp. NKC19-16]